MAELAEAEGQLVAAVGYMEELATASEEMRAGIGDQTLRAAAGATGAGRVRRHTRLLMALGYGERAYWVSERARARSLAEMLTDAGSGSTAVPANGKTAEMVVAITGVQKQLFRDGISAERRGVLLGELAKAEMDWELYRTQFSKAAGAGAVLEQPVLAGDTALIEYSLGEKESYAWVVTAAGVKSFVLAGRGAIESRVKALRELLDKPVNALTAGRSMAAFETEAGKAFAMVLGPLEGALRGKKRIVIVPDGRLHYLPFEVLPGVLAKYRVSYAPSAAALAALEKRGRARTAPERTLLAVADPVLTGAVGAERGFAFTQLPNARAEATAIRGMFGGARALVGAEAGEGAVKGADLGAYRYVHFATHGYFDEVVPGRSGLVLGQGRDEDGFLQAREIIGMKLNADVVTLSACQSGLGKLLDGEGVVGLSRAFLYAGAQGMVVSLWNVNDAATAELMKTFYAGMRAGLGGAEALRRAKVSMAQGGNRAWRHPYFWAPFVFVGDAGK
jgi:CHAT domain-containing protein